ncbi:MAG: NAD(P)H-hydrate dehydratase [Gemmatimonadetes bacterium]|nr:NAD(P)H-hydrate dehydratase [Gemmatimonadota bacterium]
MNGRDVYGREHVAVLTAAQAAGVDREARERFGVADRVLMENAGRAAALVLQRLFPEGRVVGVVGGGNNGGDALVLLRTLRAWGRNVAWIRAAARTPDADLLHGFDVASLDAAAAPAALASASVIVDGLLGTGSTGAPRGATAELIKMLNESGRPVLAIDVPSGVDPTTGNIPGAAVRGDVTVTFGWPKQGLLLQPGRSHCGRLIAVEIGFPPLAPARPLAAVLITPAWAAARLPPRAPDAHKGSVGRLLVLAGSRGMAGAAALAAHGGVRAGAGLVLVASAEANRPVLQSLVPEAVFVDRADAALLESRAAEAAALLAGPGIGVDDDARATLERVLAAAAGRPTLLDADALTLVAGEKSGLERLAQSRPLLLTPHPGEMQRLSGAAVEEIRAAPLEAARELAERVGCVVLLKGAPSVVAAPGEPALINTVGSSDLASAGMGDQLAGTIGAFLAAGAPPRIAAALGLFYSGRAADLAARGRALTPRDVADHLDRAFAAPGPTESSLGLAFVTFDQPPRW